jgi:hypothetical protein
VYEKQRHMLLQQIDALVRTEVMEVIEGVGDEDRERRKRHCDL